jgi:hypothetical protein
MSAAMRRHALGVMLLGGWVLLEAPLGHDTDRGSFPDVGRPLAQWQKVSEFDTKQACDQARIDRVSDAEATLGTDAEANKAGSPITAAWQARKAARCVTAAEVYPPEPLAEPE